MKRLIALLLCCAMTLCLLAACGSGSAAHDDAGDDATPASAEDSVMTPSDIMTGSDITRH